MTSPTRRRPLPALVFLLALCLLAALVWWRVLNRGSTNAGSPTAGCSTAAPTAAAGQLPNPATVTVLVVNSTDRAGIAGTARTALLAAGFSIPDAAKNDSQQYGGKGTPIPDVAEIRFGPDGDGGAHLLAYYLPGSKLVQTDAQGSTVIVSLGQKYQKVAAKEAVQAKLTTDKLTVAPAPTKSASPTGSASASRSAPASPSPTC